MTNGRRPILIAVVGVLCVLVLAGGALSTRLWCRDSTVHVSVEGKDEAGWVVFVQGRAPLRMLVSNRTRREAYLLDTGTGFIGVPNRSSFYDLSCCALPKGGELPAAHLSKLEQADQPRMGGTFVEFAGREGRRIRLTW